MLETKETELKITQLTNTFQGSKKLANWDQTGQKWQTELSDSDKGQVTPKPVDAPNKPQAPNTATTSSRGKEISFKRQKDRDTFHGATTKTTAPKKSDSFRAGASVLFGLGCLALSRLS